MSTNKVELTSALLTFLGRVSAKWSERDDLVDGAAYEIHAECHGSVNGVGFDIPLDGILTVGHESVAASSATPKQTNILAAILSKLNKTTQASVVQDLLDEYRETGDVVASDHMIEMAEMLLAGIRSQKQVTRRGDVRVTMPTKDCMMVMR